MLFVVPMVADAIESGMWSFATLSLGEGEDVDLGSVSQRPDDCDRRSCATRRSRPAPINVLPYSGEARAHVSISHFFNIRRQYPVVILLRA